MPWFKIPKKEKHHYCEKPFVWPWRRDGDLWGCSECGWIFKLIKPGLDNKRWGHSWVLEDSRGWYSPTWDSIRLTSVSRASEKKITTEEWERQQN